MTIEVTLTALPNSYTPEKGCMWEARCIVGGSVCIAQSRGGALHELCRVLKEANVPDCPIRTPALSYPSFHEAAEFTIRENRSVGPVRVKWKPFPKGINNE